MEPLQQRNREIAAHVRECLYDTPLTIERVHPYSFTVLSPPGATDRMGEARMQVVYDHERGDEANPSSYTLRVYELVDDVLHHGDGESHELIEVTVEETYGTDVEVAGMIGAFLFSY